MINMTICFKDFIPSEVTYQIFHLEGQFRFQAVRPFKLQVFKSYIAKKAFMRTNAGFSYISSNFSEINKSLRNRRKHVEKCDVTRLLWAERSF